MRQPQKRSEEEEKNLCHFFEAWIALCLQFPTDNTTTRALHDSERLVEAKVSPRAGSA